MAESPAETPLALALLGPTASGKSALALEIAARFPVEIVSVDSAQVFRDMNIGTAKPDAATLARVPHHLIDLVTPEERYSAARFRADALRAMDGIRARRRIPLLAGGTMLYYRALREGLADLPPADPGLRAAIDADAERFGWPALHARLAAADAPTAARLAPHDAQRIQRALEVFELTGQPMSALLARQTAEPLPLRLVTLALEPTDRGWLHGRIAERFHAMLADGLVAEVESLRSRYRLTADLPAMRCVGYRQVWECLEGGLSAAELPDRGIYATRQLAKRQLTWMRAMNEVVRIDPQGDGALTQALALVSAAIPAPIGR